MAAWAPAPVVELNDAGGASESAAAALALALALAATVPSPLPATLPKRLNSAETEVDSDMSCELACGRIGSIGEYPNRSRWRVDSDCHWLEFGVACGT